LGVDKEGTLRLEGKVALVTGAARGIGSAIAALLVEQGAQVVACDVNADEGSKAAGAIGARFLQSDVSSEQDWIRLVEVVRKEFGRLHVLVNNAGSEGIPGARKDPEGAGVEDWDQIFGINCRGTFLGCKHGVPLIAASGGGSIVNLSSVAALVPVPFIAAYGAAKAAVQHLSTTVALHCARSGHRIRCNSVHPGQVRTPMLNTLFERWASEQGVPTETIADQVRAGIPLGAFQEPIDVANLVAFLASEESRYITGQALVVDGGFTLVT
jgi:3(or 17)beta-hydroxysteroid dehydrogenase